MMLLKDLRSKSRVELEQELGKISRQLFDLEMGLSLGKLKNTAVLKQSRREVARVQTILGEKEVLEFASARAQRDGKEVLKDG